VVLLVALGAAAIGPATARRGLLPLQLVLLGIATGLTAAARVDQSAGVPTGTRTTPAEILTGAPLPDVPTAGRLLGGWQPDALWLLLGAGLVLAYVACVVRVRRVGARWSRARVVSWSAGVVLLVWLTCGGPAEYAPVLLSAHLAQHAGVASVVPLLLAGGAPLRLLSASGAGVARAERRGIPLLRRPVPAAVLAAGAFVALYGTGLLRWSVTDAVGTEWALLQCLITGALLVRALIVGGRRTAVPVAIGLLLVETCIAAVPVIGPGLLLADWFGALGWGADALVDQRLGAVLAWAIAAVATLALLVVAARRRTGSPPPVRTDSSANHAPRLEVSA
jgi:cytochrome c oxidase assembly factor CtaG